MDQAIKELEAAASPSVLEVIAPHVDAAFYLAHNPDVRDAGIAPAEHYWRIGWREGRDPNPWFQTEYYLRANPDVRAAGLNPLWHFLARGREEGRPPRPPGGPWRAQLDALRPPAERAAPRVVPPDAATLEDAALTALLRTACLGARGLVVAFSHDRYTMVPGGTQLLIADEQRKFNGDGAVYLHLSPVEARLHLAPLPAGREELGVILDGAWHGVARLTAVLAALASLPQALPRLLVVHTLHGLRPESVVAVAEVLRPAHALAWAHDYGAACGSPRLLRNDIAFCGAPPMASLACRICAYGEERAEHAARVRALFRAVPMQLVAPSLTAAATWLRATALPVTGVRIHPHARLEQSPEPAPPPEGAPEGSPVRLAFIGSAAYHKGWESFTDLLTLLRQQAPDLYAVHHFASPAELQPRDGLISVASTVTPGDPFAMVRALATHRIELVLALSPWPETFGYAAHEAIAAGAHVLALAGSGHIAELVRRTGCGAVLPDLAALAAFLLDGRAAAAARARRAEGQRRWRLRHCGSTATLPAEGAEIAPITDDPDLHLLLGGVRLEGETEGDTWRFALPPGGEPTRTVRLRSRFVWPVWEPDLPHDGRRLGVPVASLLLDDTPLPPDDGRRLGGWHAPEPQWQWTDGNAVLRVGATTMLEVRAPRVLRYWRAPLLEHDGFRSAQPILRHHP
jgi:hypothetical protein